LNWNKTNHVGHVKRKVVAGKIQNSINKLDEKRKKKA
jgi:hypothetical protein